MISLIDIYLVSCLPNFLINNHIGGDPNEQTPKEIENLDIEGKVGKTNNKKDFVTNANIA